MAPRLSTRAKVAFALAFAVLLGVLVNLGISAAVLDKYTTVEGRKALYAAAGALSACVASACPRDGADCLTEKALEGPRGP